MTRHTYLLSNIAILAALVFFITAVQETLFDPAIAWLAKAPFARMALYWLGGVLFVLWLVSAPVWSWASLRRLRHAGYPGWWCVVPTALGLCAILIVLLGGYLLGAELRGATTLMPPSDPVPLTHADPQNPALITWILRLSGFLVTIGAAFTAAVIVMALGPERPDQQAYTV